METSSKTMNHMKSPSRQLYYGLIKATTEHMYSLYEYQKYAESNPAALIPTVTIIRRYAIDGKLTRMENFIDGKLECITEYQFNAKGQVISSLDIDPAGIHTRRSVNIYNKDGLIEEWRVYSDMVNLDFRMLYSYDSQGKLFSESLIHENHEEYSISFYEHLDDNTIISISKDDKGRFIEKTIEEYDPTGNLISFRNYDESGRLKREGFYTYDIHNNQLSVKMKHYSEEGIEHTGREYEYLYDHKDNWIRAIHQAGEDKYSNVCIREIEYYT